MCSTSTRSTEVQYYYIISQKYKYFASGKLATATMKSAPGWHNHNHNPKNMARQKKTARTFAEAYIVQFTRPISIIWVVGRGY